MDDTETTWTPPPMPVLDSETFPGTIDTILRIGESMIARTDARDDLTYTYVAWQAIHDIVGASLEAFRMRGLFTEDRNVHEVCASHAAAVMIEVFGLIQALDIDPIEASIKALKQLDEMRLAQCAERNRQLFFERMDGGEHTIHVDGAYL